MAEEKEIKELTIDECRTQTQKHIDLVNKLGRIYINELNTRLANHDKSKLESPEVEEFAKVTNGLASTTYGSEEYMKFLKEDLAIALEHHYAHNRHHPEHFGERGVDAMNLFDLVEMFLDWLAASKRQNNGNLMVSIDKSCERFNITGTLANILRNTVDYFDAILSAEDK